MHGPEDQRGRQEGHRLPQDGPWVHRHRGGCQAKVKGHWRTWLSARHVPAVILETKDVPVSVCESQLSIELYLQDQCGFGWIASTL